MESTNELISNAAEAASELAMLRSEEATAPLILAISLLADAISPEMREEIATSLEKTASDIDFPTANGADQFRSVAAAIRGNG